MGSYASFKVGGFSAGWSKNGIDPSLILLFRRGDLDVTEVEPGTPEYEALWAQPPTPENEEPITLVRYLTTTSILRDRLELLGFTAATCRRVFAEVVDRERRAISARREETEDSDGLMRDYYASELLFYANITVDAWIDGVRELHQAGLAHAVDNEDELEGLSDTARFMLRDNVDAWFALPAVDRRFAIRLVLEALPDEEVVEYDLTDLVAGGWVETPELLIEESQRLLTAEAIVADRVIVLTEGSSDKWILQAAVEILAPHLADYFSFMDFEGARIAGGAAALAATVKAFVGAGILNRVVAVFDNDTAAAEALRSLSKVALPSNFAVIQYPDTPFLMNYPTLGPTGIVSANVNGVAGSIELYLGPDSLRSETGSYEPVQWRGYNDALQRYQGEVQHKARIHDRFREKVARARATPDQIVLADWASLLDVVARLKAAFAQTASESLAAFEEQAHEW